MLRQCTSRMQAVAILYHVSCCAVTEERSYLHIQVYFSFFVLALARALPESQLLALVCADSKQLETMQMPSN